MRTGINDGPPNSIIRHDGRSPKPYIRIPKEEFDKMMAEPAFRDIYERIRARFDENQQGDVPFQDSGWSGR